MTTDKYEADRTREVIATQLWQCRKLAPKKAFGLHMNQATFNLLAWGSGAQEKSFSRLAIRGALVPVVIDESIPQSDNTIYILPLPDKGQR